MKFFKFLNTLGFNCSKPAIYKEFYGCNFASINILFWQQIFFVESALYVYKNVEKMLNVMAMFE